MAKKKHKKNKSKRQDSIKTTKITMNLGGVIPTAPFANMRVDLGTEAHLSQGLGAKKGFSKLQEMLYHQFQVIENRAKADVIDRDYPNILFRPKNGMKFPRVTSILGWENSRKMPVISIDKLNQYAARGTIVHKLIYLYLETGKWHDPLKLPELKEEVATLNEGSLNFSWLDCSYKDFFRQYRKRLGKEGKWNGKKELTVFNEEHCYSGQIDLMDKFEEKKSIIDIKTGTYDMRQLAAYAACEKKIEQMVVFDVGPTENKCGYIRPVTDERIKDHFRSFVDVRDRFRQRFGV